MAPFRCIRFGDENAGVPFDEEQNDNEAPGSPPNEEEGQNVYITRGEQAHGLFRGLEGDNIIIFSYRQLCDATNNFADESIGQGSWGRVFRGQLAEMGRLIGRLEEDGQIVAIKELNQNGEARMTDEINMHFRLNHSNIIKLMGYCLDPPHPYFLVYEFMPWRSLKYHLHDIDPERGPLDWNTRMEIAAGVAKAMDYLHDVRVIFRDLKSSSVLLGEGYHPKLSDFQMAISGAEDDDSHGSSNARFNPEYRAPEDTGASRITLKMDVYSFGILLLEILSGEIALAPENDFIADRLLPKFKEGNILGIADPNLNGEFSKGMLDKAVQVALMCMRKDPDNRPTMKEVMIAMNYLKFVKYNANERTSDGGGRLPEGPGEGSSSGANQPGTGMSPKLTELLSRIEGCGVVEAMSFALEKLDLDG